jgi:ribose/xylose/arabinose/galactoside ABC-type transport system permease subunit
MRFRIGFSSFAICDRLASGLSSANRAAKDVGFGREKPMGVQETMGTESTPSPRLAKPASPLIGALTSRQSLLVLINIAIIAGLTVLRPDAFPNWTNLKAVLSLMSYDLLIAIAMTIVLIVRGIDLSVGSVLALSSVTMALLMRGGTPVIPALLAGLTVALVCGLINGLLVAVVGILPFLVTLGMMSIARGVATVLTTGQYISFPNAAPWFTQFGRYEFQAPNALGHYGLPVTLVIGLALVVITSLLFSYWVPLRTFFFVGESPEAARLSGIKVTRLTLAAYLLSTLFVWFTAVLLTSANKIGYANYGVGAELRALAAAVVGGASLAGGAGNIFGTFLGVLMLALIGNGFVMLNGNPNWQQASVGIVLIAAVGIDALRTYRERR